MKSEQMPEGKEGVGYMDTWGKVFQTSRSVYALRSECTGHFKEQK